MNVLGRVVTNERFGTWRGSVTLTFPCIGTRCCLQRPHGQGTSHIATGRSPWPTVNWRSTKQRRVKGTGENQLEPRWMCKASYLESDRTILGLP